MCRYLQRVQGVEDEHLETAFSNAVLIMARMAIDQRLPGRAFAANDCALLWNRGFRSFFA